MSRPGVASSPTAAERGFDDAQRLMQNSLII